MPWTEKQITLPITGMHCTNCSDTITRELGKLDGVGDSKRQLRYRESNDYVRIRLCLDEECYR